MQNVVIDTNVVISATLSPNGNPSKIMNMVFDGEIQIYYCQAILDEYTDVLARTRLHIAFDTQHNIMNGIRRFGVLTKPITSNMALPDESDRMFFDVATHCEAILITGNLKHYPLKSFIMTPTDYLTVHKS